MTNEIININLTRKIGWIKVKQVMNQVYLIPEQCLGECEYENLEQMCEDLSAMLHCVVNRCYVPTADEAEHLPEEIRGCDNYWWTSTVTPSGRSAYCVTPGGCIGSNRLIGFPRCFRPIIVIDYEEYKTLMEVK